ncbi:MULTISPECIES: hypothetical protein [unclassified Bradyrhizobium]|uniref:hypothetical protein n=1 Tax=unclassified Bradyrhizobium TaxID=2631580 RepID=UPI001FFA02F3|nr:MULTISPECIES: hypothetical protein [unclassified Bradyrhizobium]
MLPKEVVDSAEPLFAKKDTAARLTVRFERPRPAYPAPIIGGTMMVISMMLLLIGMPTVIVSGIITGIIITAPAPAWAPPRTVGPL